MAAGKISIQANDGKVAGVVFEDGASSNVTVTVPKEGGNVVTDKDATITSNLNMVGTGLRITGDFSNATVANRTFIQTSALNGSTSVQIIPNGTSNISQLIVTSSSDAANNSQGRVDVRGDVGEVQIVSSKAGTGTYLPMTFHTSGAERMRIDTAGNVLVTGSGGLGYGGGAGGTVTQLTSKSTAVTLNKPCGQIIMNNAALAAGASVAFMVYNSMITLNDTIIASFSDVGAIDETTYSLTTIALSGGIGIAIKNNSAITKSDALVINFSVIKGAVS